MYKPNLTLHSSIWNAVIVLIVLTTAEFLVFGISYPKIGFYLDDWSMLCELFFGPRNWLALPAMYFFDPRMTVRPIEVIYYPWLYLLFGIKPLLWHVFNGAIEVLGAWFLYLVLSRIGISTFLALSGSVLFLINPWHDSTHYWVTASSSTFSIALYLLSLWQALRAAQIGSVRYRVCSAITFAIAVFNHESVLPLFVVSLWYVAFVEWKQGKKIDAVIKNAFGFALIYLPTCILMVIYERFLLPALRLGNNRALALDPLNMIKVVWEGFNCLLGPYAFDFLNQQAWLGITAFRAETLLILLCSLTAVTAIGAIALNLMQQRTKLETTNYVVPTNFRHKIASYALALLFPGVLCIVVSYVMVGVAVIYHPTLLTTINRINFGGTIGAILLILFLLALLQSLLKSSFRSAVISYVPISLCVAALLTYYALADWGYSLPWIRSATTQRLVQKSLLKHRSEIPKGGNLILAGCPRYDMWAPVFDGVWSFYGMSHIVLSDPNLNANVVSNRLEFTDNMVKDISQGYLCGSYPLKGLKILLLPQDEIATVNNAREFVKLIQPYYSISQVPSEIFHRWELQSSKIR